MQAMGHRKFTNPLLLMSVARDILGEFLGTFGTDLAAAGVVLPDSTAPDNEYFAALAKMILSPEDLPLALNEAMHAVEDMADGEGRARLTTAVQAACLHQDIRQESSDLDFAVQVWLRAPALFACKHAELGTSRYCTFEHFAAAHSTNRSQAFALPGTRTIEQMTTAIDAWYASRHKGVGTTAIEAYPLVGKFLFLVRHGDTYVRALTAGRQQRKVIHYRPEKDDVVIYVPGLDELRVAARTPGEVRLYRECFGYHLFGDLEYFSSELTCTLAPLATLGEHALDTDGLKGVYQITLTELDVDLASTGSGVRILKAADVFALAAATGENLFPAGCTVTRAVFAFQFAPGGKRHSVQVRPPNKLKVARGCDDEAVHHWLLLRGFRVLPRRS